MSDILCMIHLCNKNCDIVQHQRTFNAILPHNFYHKRKFASSLEQLLFFLMASINLIN